MESLCNKDKLEVMLHIGLISICGLCLSIADIPTLEATLAYLQAFSCSDVTQMKEQTWVTLSRDYLSMLLLFYCPCYIFQGTDASISTKEMELERHHMVS